nr:hypothetical protein [uncultured Psychroserpens sp.]
METNKNITKKVDLVLDSANTIIKPNVSPFFKDKTLQRLFAEKEVKKSAWSWFNPKLQLATLAGVLFLNIYAIKEIQNTNYNQSISSFAQNYGLISSEESSLFNL